VGTSKPAMFVQRDGIPLKAEVKLTADDATRGNEVIDLASPVVPNHSVAVSESKVFRIHSQHNKGNGWNSKQRIVTRCY